MKLIPSITAIVILFSSTALANSTGGTPAIPCYKEGKMISTTMPITECKKKGGTHLAD